VDTDIICQKKGDKGELAATGKVLMRGVLRGFGLEAASAVDPPSPRPVAIWPLDEEANGANEQDTPYQSRDAMEDIPMLMPQLTIGVQA
jgi:hypothetical protein